MLTELDYCILGIVWRAEPMTAYAVRSHLARSTTPAWSSSTGTVYPSIKRLRASGLIESKGLPGPRGRELLGVTPAGVSALAAWLAKEDLQLGRATADPIRTRVHFLKVLPQDQRRSAIARYQQVTQAAVHELEALVHTGSSAEADRSEQLGTLGALAELRARMEWLSQVERALTYE